MENSRQFRAGRPANAPPHVHLTASTSPSVLCFALCGGRANRRALDSRLNYALAFCFLYFLTHRNFCEKFNSNPNSEARAKANEMKTLPNTGEPLRRRQEQLPLHCRQLRALLSPPPPPPPVSYGAAPYRPKMSVCCFRKLNFVAAPLVEFKSFY